MAKTKNNKLSILSSKRNISILLIVIIAAFGAWRVFISGASPNNCQPEKGVNICDIDQVQGNLDNVLSNGPEAQNLGKDTANWPLYFGTAFRAPTSTLDGAQPVYRVYNGSVTWHDYMFEAGKKDKEAKAPGQVANEGIAFYAWPSASRPGLVPVYRLTQSGGTTKVIFTTDSAWRDKVIAADTNNPNGWKDGGVPFYAFPPNYQAIAPDNKPQANPYDCSVKENFISERCAAARKNLEQAVANGTVGSSNECPATLDAYVKELFPSRFTQECRNKWNTALTNPSNRTVNPAPTAPTNPAPTAPTNPAPTAPPLPDLAKIACDGDGVSGNRVQYMYLYFEGEPNRLEQKRSEIIAQAVRADQTVQKTAQKTKGMRKIRYVHDNKKVDCNLDIKSVMLTKADQQQINNYGDESLEKLIGKLSEKKFGLTSSLRKYTFYVDHNMKSYGGTCGLAGPIGPANQAETNAFVQLLRSKGATINNQADFDNLFETPNPITNINENLPGIAIFPTGNVDNNGRLLADCSKPIIAAGDRAPSDVQTHELMHTFGAVSSKSPHGSTKGHCHDEFDLMCYKDDSTALDFSACTNPTQNFLLDCGNDDYFSTNPPAGSYLANNWNIANSQFFIR